MADDLKVSYHHLQSAAAAMTTAGHRIASARSSLTSHAHLTSDDFGDKGGEFASWYAENLSGAQQALQASSHSFDVLAQALHRAAAVYALVDALAARDAHLNGKGH